MELLIRHFLHIDVRLVEILVRILYILKTCRLLLDYSFTELL